MDASEAHQTLPHARSRNPRASPLEIKQVSPSGTFKGYASLFDHVDMSGDIVVRGAFRETLAKRGARGVKLLYQHEVGEPIGIWTTIEEDDRGLYVEGRILSDVARGRDVLALMQEGALDGLSIGFKTVRARRDRPGGSRRLEKVDLWEISIVTFPLLPEARIATVKSSRSAARPRSHEPRSEADLASLLHRTAFRLAPEVPF